MEWALLLKEFLAAMGVVVSSGYFIKSVKDGSAKELSKELINAVKGAGQSVSAFVKYVSGRVVEEGTAQNEKTLAALAAIRGKGDEKYVTGKCLLYEDGSERGGAFGVMDKVTALLSTVGACGLEMTTERARGLVDTLGIDWSKYLLSNGKIMTIIDEEGKTEYMPNELVNEIKDKLYEKGAFDTNVEGEPNVNPISIPLLSIKTAAKKWLEYSLSNYGYHGADAIARPVLEGCMSSILSLPDKFWNNELGGINVFYSTRIVWNDNYKVVISVTNEITDIKTVDEWLPSNKSFYDSNIGLWTDSVFLFGTGFTIVKKKRINRIKNIAYFTWNDYRNKNDFTTQITYGELETLNNSSLSCRMGVLNVGTETFGLPEVYPQTGALLPTYEEQMDALLERLGQTKGKVKYRAEEDKEAVEYIPITRPIAKEDEKVGTLPQDKVKDDVAEDTLEEIIKDTIPTTEDVIADNPPLPQPTFPPIGVITIPNLDPIGDTGFVGIYNPTRLQLRQFTGWLWSDEFLNFVAKKMFGDPFNAIISLHAIYCNPTANGSSNIICGRTNSHITVNTVNQYVEVNCGNIKINRYFNNARDYQAKIEIYLPFIGVRDLDISELLDRTINVTYKVDVLTGTCIAMIKIDGQVLYHFEGNCACQIPISGQSYSALFGALTAAAGVAIGAATGGAALPVVAAAGAAGIAASKEPVKKSGNFGSNSGAMDIKKPYLIITRNVPYEAGGREEFEGLPCNVTRMISQCSGFTKIKEINLNNVTATKQELEELKELMMEGIIL